VNPAERDATGIFRALVRQNETMGQWLMPCRFHPGELVCAAQDMGSSMFLVAAGRVQLYRTTRDGRRFVVATLGPGAMFGEASLLGGEAPDTDAVGLEAGTVWSMPGEAAKEMLSTDAMFGFGLVQAMGQRVKEAENRLEHMAYRTISSRLASLLLDLGGDDPAQAVCATHYELAVMLGTWRETVSKTLQDFRQRGLVASGRRRLILLDRQGLREMTGWPAEPL
jgi:CRP/FNR family cyclic AMP-dependent transcriptional regulator